MRPVRYGNWGARLAVRNLLNQDRREPTRAPGHVLYDLPLAGRLRWLEATWGF